MAEKMICSSECVDCVYCTLNEISKAKVKIVCSIKGKEFYYGQMIPCDNKKLHKTKQD